MTSVALPLYDAVLAALRDGDDPNAALAALGVTYVGERPTGSQSLALPYVLFTGDTEAPDVLFSDKDAAAASATLTLTVWSRSASAAKRIAAAVIEEVTGGLTIEGHGLIRASLDLNADLGRDPGGDAGRSVRFRFTTTPA